MIDIITKNKLMVDDGWWLCIDIVLFPIFGIGWLILSEGVDSLR